MKSLIIAAVTAFSLTAFAPAFADEAATCGDAPESDWMSEDAIKEVATELGYEVKELKVEDGCYEIYGIKDGEQAEVFFNPVTGELVRSEASEG